MKNTRKLVLSALFVAIGIILPQVFHTIPNAGQVILPMHIPVLLCGLICGPMLGLTAGVVTPLLSSLLTGMPVAARLPGMLCELAVYGLVTGVLMGKISVKNKLAKVYIAQICAMIAGRITYGVLNTLIFKAGAYSFEIWLSAALVTAIPGIVIQLVLIPMLVLALEKAKLIEL